MIEHRLIEELSGSGTLIVDDVSRGVVKYSIARYQDIHHAGGEEIPGLEESRGQLVGVDLFDLIGCEAVVLLKDGRRWPCLIEGISGAAIGNGDLK